MSGQSSGKRAQGLCGWLQLTASSESSDLAGTQQSEPSPRSRKRNRGGGKKWENVSLGNAPMLIRRGCIAASERRTSKESIAALNDWNDNVTFMIYGKEAKVRGQRGMILDWLLPDRLD